MLESGKCQFGIHEFTLNKGDTLLLYTDGLVENEGPGGEVLNFRIMKSLLTKPAPLESIIQDLEKTARTLWSGQKLADDVTFLGIRYQGL